LWLTNLMLLGDADDPDARASIKSGLQRDPEAIFGSSERSARDGGVDL
jgi:hypothetical protein